MMRFIAFVTKSLRIRMYKFWKNSVYFSLRKLEKTEFEMIPLILQSLVIELG
mgnify:CR=1 FL=1